ncbi:MAG TPA: hypothetical protein VK787_00910 [Puia sp.]|nr:hypothetical protein [Puia sp.]
MNTEKASINFLVIEEIKYMALKSAISINWSVLKPTTIIESSK